jgi:hypothetical protein
VVVHNHRLEVKSGVRLFVPECKKNPDTDNKVRGIRHAVRNDNSEIQFGVTRKDV